MGGDAAGFEHQARNHADQPGCDRGGRSVAEAGGEVGVAGGRGDAVKDADSQQQHDPEQSTHHVGLHRRLSGRRGTQQPDESVERDAGKQVSRCQNKQSVAPARIKMPVVENSNNA